MKLNPHDWCIITAAIAYMIGFITGWLLHT
jgi:hypothetical protein